ncbi:MAG: hypothetical protein PUD02_01505 [Eggerthellales bacterium]|nr:hypothetical protein [Eggerthellales bacterium]
MESRCTRCCYFEECKRSQRGKRTCERYAVKPKRSSKKPLAIEKRPTSPDWVVGELVGKCSFLDLRSTHGFLWVKGGHKRDALIAELRKMGARFEYREKGSRETDGRSGWILWGYPKKKDPSGREKTGKGESPQAKPPRKTKSHASWVGRRMFHREYGYGFVSAVEGGIAKVEFSDQVTREVDLDNSPSKAFWSNKRFKKGELRAEGKPSIFVGDFVVHAEYGGGIVRGVEYDSYGTGFATVEFGDATKIVSSKAMGRGDLRLMGPQDISKKKKVRIMDIPAG